MMDYIAKVKTAIFPLGLVAKGEKLRKEHLDALGTDTIADMVRRGVLICEGAEAPDDYADADYRDDNSDMGDESADMQQSGNDDADTSDGDDTQADTQEDEIDEDEEAPEIDVMAGIVQTGPEEAVKPTAKRKSAASSGSKRTPKGGKPK